MAVNRIRFLRESQHRSRKELAQAIGKSEVTLWRYERGKSEMTGSVIINLAEELGVSISELFIFQKKEMTHVS